MSGLRRAVLLAFACSSAPLAAAMPAPAKAPSEPLILLPVPLPVPAPAAEAPAAANQVTPELPPPPAPAEATAAAPVAASDSGAPAPAMPIPAMTSGEETFARVRRNLGSAKSCDAGNNSARWRQRYAGNPATFSMRLKSVLPLLDFVSVEVERARLPAEFTFIPLVESWYQPAAIGVGGPAGMWQMIGSTARNHGIHIREGYDGRLSPVESTRAALSYLKTLQGMFGDWQAIVMAYNAGEGRMQRALRRAGSRVTSASERRPHGLSNITYDYVDKLQALSCLVSQPHRFGLRLPVETRFEPLVPLLMDPGVQTLDAFARAHDKDPAELKRLNPGFRNGRVVAGVPRLVLAPPVANPDAAKVAVAPPPLPFDLLAGADDEFDAGAEGEIAEMLETALLPVDDEAAASTDARESPAMTPVADTATQPAGPGAEGPAEAAAVLSAGRFDPPPPVHEVRAGESLWSIAKYYQLPVEQIRRANGLDSKATVHPGQVLQLVP